MRIILKSFLTIFFILLFIVLVLSVTFKFQLLKTGFWENTFQSTDTYQTLSLAVTKNLENSVVTKGGKTSDVAVFTDLATTENLKDLTNRNIENLLNYVNGKNSRVYVYIPVGRLPESLLPKDLGDISQQIALEDFLKLTGVASVSASQIQTIQNVPRIVNTTFLISVILVIMNLLAFFGLTEHGKRLVSPGVALIVSGGIIFTGAKLFDVVNNGLFQNLVQRKDLGGVIVGVMVPPIITEISKVWILLGIAAVVMGLILFFIKKPYNNLKK